ncbi:MULTISPECIES: rubrerythrin-like domain-containing protein [Halobellus]|nr:MULTISPECIES: rubrerythrin-like domain-containing protein [Halobellus]MDQ2055654.1 rubrerythrin-like domain-containing protein [Halobellus sp. H-GB7]RLM87973.1 rubrerythrin-like domain-containing protein [Halobellus sp. Atlit-38R]
MKDVDIKPAAEAVYECFECGNILLTEENPGTCPDCSGPMRNRQMPLE